jgi:hypothetical protein
MVTISDGPGDQRIVLQRPLTLETIVGIDGGGEVNGSPVIRPALLHSAPQIVDRRPSMAGSDSSGLEVTPNPDRQLIFPVHQELITKNGVWNLENLHFEELLAERAYEFLFVFTPVRFKGATGSPGRPLAIR